MNTKSKMVLAAVAGAALGAAAMAAQQSRHPSRPIE